MKKFSLLLFTTLFLLGCSNEQVDNSSIKNVGENETEDTDVKKENSSEDENQAFTLKPVDEFIEHYNSMSSLTDGLSPLTLEQPKDENGTQILLQEDNYAILAIFDDNDNVTTYAVGLTQDDGYSELKGSGLDATLHVSEALELDFEKMANEFEVALKEDEHTYFDDTHMVIFENHERSGKSGLGMMVRFMNLSTKD